MIALLDSGHYLAPLEPVNEGAQFTHMARVNFAGEIATAYVKLYPRDSGGLIGETLGYVAAAAHDIPRPQHAAILQLWPEQLAGLPLPPWLDASEGAINAWCCERVPGKSLEHYYRCGEQDDDLWRQVLTSLNAAAIVGIDEWIANRDRNNGNLIRLSPKVWAVIDHGEALGSQLWPQTQPQDFGISQLLQHANDLLKEDRRKTLRSGVLNAATTHQALVVDLEPLLPQLLAHLGLSGPGAAVLPFLTQRAQPAWVAQRTGMLI